ncbi:MAG: 3-keto-5-aminohexanoate cleavage protein [Dehalococcoidia bacterium]|nr:MAG: 3-keto-5-aminohexanoate cleavage protein [Dehalococcoidia bacterium]
MEKGKKLIITAALSGGATFKANNPKVPYTPEEFADECEKCVKYGVSIVHIHARDPKTEMATADLKIIKATVKAIRERCPELIINLSSAITSGLTPEQRIAPVIELKPEMASMNTATMNDGIADHKSGEVFFEYTFENKLGMVADFAKIMKQHGVKPELEVYDPAGIYNVLLLRKQKDLFVEPLHFQFVYGAFGGIDFNPTLHLAMLDLLPEGATYGVCGVGPHQIPAAVMSALHGGHVRIGLEDNTRVPGGELAQGSWEQAVWVQEIARILDRPIATPSETRELLGLRSQA